jgi:hypothetical protein
VYKIVETLSFEREWPNYWTEIEHSAFRDFVAQNPLAGVVVPHTGGVRKIRWRRLGIGKSGGVLVIYFVRTAKGQIFLLKIYAKTKTDNVPASELRRIRNAIEE